MYALVYLINLNHDKAYLEDGASICLFNKYLLNLYYEQTVLNSADIVAYKCSFPNGISAGDAES